MSAAELPTPGLPLAAGLPPAELRVASLASGLLILLDAHRITGRLPREVQAQAWRLRHAVKLAIYPTTTAAPPPAPLAHPQQDPGQARVAFDVALAASMAARCWPMGGRWGLCTCCASATRPPASIARCAATAAVGSTRATTWGRPRVQDY